MWDTVKNLLQTRGVQLLSRYAGVGLTWCAAKVGVVLAADQLTSASSGLSLLAIGGLCFGIDLWIHSAKKDDKK